MENPRLYIIAGPNGAGKTTASFTVLPEVLDCNEFVNADEIAKGLSPFKPEEVAIQAGKLMLQRIDQLLERQETFAIETTLATNGYVKLIEKAHDLGYQVFLLFFWLDSPKTAEKRVAMRVKEGGHNIPVEVINRRYWRGLSNFFNKFVTAVDYWAIYDSNDKTSLIASSDRISNPKLFNELRLCLNRKK